jgi:hypothetical protein
VFSNGDASDVLRSARISSTRSQAMGCASNKILPDNPEKFSDRPGCCELTSQDCFRQRARAYLFSLIRRMPFSRACCPAESRVGFGNAPEALSPGFRAARCRALRQPRWFGNVQGASCASAFLRMTRATFMAVTSNSENAITAVPRKIPKIIPTAAA